ncbi:hypothetical protein GQ607_001873 [Colletotrichum asianum]|uniref:Uncharacterized protein n=1 Tax=Colletotrichum asianum TaxID=702518 RepID=A0A8H3WN06_9PEZI|nr:hypothetical protein GQ607_001873 [Colletotrichum asianum]
MRPIPIYPEDHSQPGFVLLKCPPNPHIQKVKYCVCVCAIHLVALLRALASREFQTEHAVGLHCFGRSAPGVSDCMPTRLFSTLEEANLRVSWAHNHGDQAGSSH